MPTDDFEMDDRFCGQCHMSHNDCECDDSAFDEDDFDDEEIITDDD